MVWSDLFLCENSGMQHSPMGQVFQVWDNSIITVSLAEWERDGFLITLVLITHIISIDQFLWSELSHGSTWVQYNMQSGWIATSQGQLYTMGGTEHILMDCFLYLLYFMTKFSGSMHSHRQAILMRFTVIIIHNLKDIMVDHLVIGCVQLQTMSQFRGCSDVSSLIGDVK